MPYALAAVILAFLAIALVIVGANRFQRPAALAPAEIVRQAPEGRTLDREFEIATWNLGYGGMGAEADFFADGGQQSRPPSADEVVGNVDGIVDSLAELDVDVLLLQECALPSWVNHRVDVLARLITMLPERDRIFGADFVTQLIPPPFSVGIGNAIFSRAQMDSAERRGLPLEPPFAGILTKQYRMHVARYARTHDGNQWVIVNIHLAAFDDEAQVRQRQLESVIAFAQQEHEAGNLVVVGGDWNLRLLPTQFPHSTDERHLFWVSDLPDGVVPAGWTWAVDPRVPTVRTAHAPYTRGENYTTIIDGFLLSPGVEAVRVEALDLNFANSDHHPVRATLTAVGE